MNDHHPDPDGHKFAVGGIVNPLPRLIGEDRDCHPVTVHYADEHGDR